MKGVLLPVVWVSVIGPSISIPIVRIIIGRSKRRRWPAIRSGRRWTIPHSTISISITSIIIKIV